MTDSRFDIGMNVRKEVLGSEHVERAQAAPLHSMPTFNASSQKPPGVPSGRDPTWIAAPEAL